MAAMRLKSLGAAQQSVLQRKSDAEKKMPTNKKTAAKELHALKSENVTLKKKLHELEAERDSYRRLVHAWAKDKVTAATLLEWDREDDDSGQTPLDIVREVKRQR